MRFGAAILLALPLLAVAAPSRGGDGHDGGRGGDHDGGRGGDRHDGGRGGDRDGGRDRDVDWSHRSKWNAPSPPWVGGKPGWYWGDHPDRHPKLPCPPGKGNPGKGRPGKGRPGKGPKPSHGNPDPTPTPTPDPTDATPPSSSNTPEPTSTPGPSDGYTPTFENLDGATQADGYLTFGLVDTVADCKAMCDSVDGCVFVNTYNDVNGKDGSTQLTCSLFNRCYDASTATNRGGQSQPDGSINYIANSSGWCYQE